MSDAQETTPMLRQYREIKGQHPDAILMVRIGDFYEMFFEDAVVASKILDIVLTSRNRNDPNPVPLCGVPYHSVESYISRLIGAGHKVALCDQVEDPKVAKGIVRREVTRVITPGLRLDPGSSRESNYLASVVPGACPDGPDLWGFSLVELSTGEFLAAELKREEVLEELEKAAEILIPESAKEKVAFSSPKVITERPDWVFDPSHGRRLLLGQFRVASLSGFDCESIPLGIAAAGAALHYICETQKVSSLPHITSLKRYEQGDHLILSETTRKSLDLDQLADLLDRTKTAMGGRRLREWVLRPLKDRALIEGRLDSVDELLQKSPLTEKLRVALSEVYDMERICGRLSLRTADARDLTALAQSLRAIFSLKGPRPVGVLSEFVHLRRLADIGPLEEREQEISATLVAEPPFSVREGGLIREGVNPSLDELREIRRSSRDYLARIEERERERTGISSLKVRFNKVFGYYIEVTTTHLSRIPADYQRKQTLTNAERFLTPELKELEGKILGAEEKIRAIEYEVFERLRDRVASEIPLIQQIANQIADLDVLQSLAQVARERGYKRPEITEENLLEIEGGRHPLVEANLPPGKFVANDLHLDPDRQRLILITGPNMAGKSTFIRQAGLIVVMAQIGSFVPADRAVIGLVDRLYSRIGASDRLTEGESTFMVEMTETASILHHATGNSLILLDEIGRGTSTFDGISIAWAVAEYLHDQTRARTLFATHYHELIDLALSRPGIKNYNVSIKTEAVGQIVFLYRVVPGGMSHSYGIHVGALAGLPAQIVERAREVLANLEQGELEQGAPRIGKKRKRDLGQASLF